MLPLHAWAVGLANGVGLRPPMGYSSWNDCASEVTEARIRRVARALVNTGLAAKGYTHVNVDEGWLKSRGTTTLAMEEDTAKFPSGMRALGEWVHAQEVPGAGRTLRYGLYTSRGTCQCSTKQYQGPGSSGHIERDAAWMVAAGADLVKVDSCCGSQQREAAKTLVAKAVAAHGGAAMLRLTPLAAGQASSRHQQLRGGAFEWRPCREASPTGDWGGQCGGAKAVRGGSGKRRPKLRRNAEGQA